MDDWRLPTANGRGINRRLSGSILACLTLLAGCDRESPGDALLVDYQHRLADALDTERPPSEQPANIGAFPDQDERLFDIPETRESLLDIYALRECQITSLIAKRNNQLGRVATPSQRWLYELELWQRLYQCWHSEVPESLAARDRQRLHRLLETKTEQLPRASWNALFASSEWVDNFSRASAPLAPDEQIPLDESLAALNYLRLGAEHQFDPNWRVDSSTLESHLQTLQREPLTARILRSLMLISLRLKEANTMLNTSLDVSGCLEDQTDVNIAPLRGDLQQHYRTEIHPYLEKLRYTARTWLEAVNALLKAHDVSRPAVADYQYAWLSLDNPQAPWPRFQQAIQTHSQYWRHIKQECDPSLKDGGA
ncbi:hypothetical protein L861_19435 [Litchfieldella anticariensis FP35 = DSM 16096]|uniref:DUF3080 domain-containing protein n=1 Tax=Litchfieldella anticariensis (strain DSM 16096 / CECT 5854 / CIP 108499 / LMG 22089 / FP35) TaxID=1121939 RepID=S2L7C3_LITA3|nr:DUF3080 family protein [Halomonas anticariensis]EPC03709.1 hypothetical protein L861_19435 [Halomonas anticariensis FP35 = DSM 16096]